MKYLIWSIFILPAFLLLLTGCQPEKSTEKAKTHTLKLTSYPEGAVAYVAGKKFDLPHNFRMTAGTYLFRIEKPGHAPAWFSCRVQSSGITVPVSGLDGTVRWEKYTMDSKQIELTPHGGTVLLQSNPNTAKIIQDGRDLGVTPMVLTDLPVGKHEVQLKSPNYADVTVSWEIRDSSPMIVHADLQSNIGQLLVNSTPAQARLFIDNQFIGVTPYRGTCAVGSHAIRLQRDGYLPYEGHITLLKGKLTEKDITLTVSPSNLNVISEPTGAQVFLNDQLRGVTPLNLKDLPAGKYKIVVSHDGFDQVEDSVELAPGDTLKKEFILASSQGGIELNVFPAGVKVFLNGREVGVVEQGEGKTQTKLLTISNLAPGTYIVKAVHKRTNPEIRRIRVQKGKITRPKRIELWVPNAEIMWKDTGKTEIGMIYGESEKIILFGPQRGIRYEIDKNQLKSIKFLDINE